MPDLSGIIGSFVRLLTKGFTLSGKSHVEGSGKEFQVRPDNKLIRVPVRGRNLYAEE
jgi:hypothetical protein